MRSTRPDLSDEQLAETERIYQTLRQGFATRKVFQTERLGAKNGYGLRRLEDFSPGEPQATEDEHWKIAQLLASKPDARLLGRTEYEVRDLTNTTGANAIQAAPDGRKKGQAS